MIELQLTEALALYSAVLAALVGGIWLYTELSVKRPQRRMGQQFLWRCTFCGCSYLDERAERLSQCPRCENYNTAEEAASTIPPVPSRAEIEDASGPEPRRNPSRRKRRGQRRGPRRRSR